MARDASTVSPKMSPPRKFLAICTVPFCPWPTRQPLSTTTSWPLTGSPWSALLDATCNVTSFALGSAVKIACDPIGRHEYDDEGVADQYQGCISCEGVIYRFTCVTFTDASGARYVETIGALEVVEWGVRLVMQQRNR